MTKPLIKKAYDSHARLQYKNKNPTLTEQNHKNKCDTTNIVTQYIKTGVVDHLNTRTEIQQNLPETMDFHTLQNIVAQGNSQFEELPVSIRKQFDYQPAEFMKFAQNPENLSAMREMGLATPLTESSSDFVAKPVETITKEDITSSEPT